DRLDLSGRPLRAVGPDRACHSSRIRGAKRSTSAALKASVPAVFALLQRGASGAIVSIRRRIAAHSEAVMMVEAGAVTGACGGQVTSPGGTAVSSTMSEISNRRCAARFGAEELAATEVIETTRAPTSCACCAISTG